ncbi:MAG: MFS transporter [Streptosporangiaceae bacterium]|nr:MFS transporter [Streptosporangiaceae bacterium]MBV9855844.1 MFS transporter [Streptosporangiaceae bacterium]
MAGRRGRFGDLAGRFARRAAGGLPRAFWVLWAGTLVNRLGLFVEPFLALYLSSARRLSLAEIGLVLAASGAGSVFSQLIGGALTDRIGRRATLTAGMLANAAALLALGYARGLPALVTAALGVGLTIDMYRPAASALVADLVPATDRARAYGLLFWAVNLGFSVAMVLGGTLARAGFIWLFWADAATCLVFGLLVWRGVPETRPRGAGDQAPGGFADVLRDPLMVAFCLLTLAVMCVYMQAYTTLPLAVAESGLPAQDYGLAMAVNGIVIVAIQPIAGPWLGRHDHARVLSLGVVLLGIGFGLTSLASATWSYAATVAIWTLGEILTSSTGPAIVANLAPPRLRGRYSGLFGLAFSAGFLIAPLAGTRLLAHGRPALWLSCAGLCAAAAVCQLALGPAIRRRESLPEESATARSV